MASFSPLNPGCPCDCPAAFTPCSAGSCVQAFLDAGFPPGSTPLSVSTSLGSFAMPGSIAAGPGCTAAWGKCQDFTASGIDNTNDPPVAATISFPVNFSLQCSGTDLVFTASYYADYKSDISVTNWKISGSPSPNTAPITSCGGDPPPRSGRACGGSLGCSGVDYAPGDSLVIPLASITYPLNLSIATSMPAFTGPIIITAP